MSRPTNKQLFFTPIVLFALLLWAGMVAGISFLEAPLKFTAPRVTLAIGLGIGRLVFSWLNKFDMFFSVLVLAGLYGLRAANIGRIFSNKIRLIQGQGGGIPVLHKETES